MAYAQGAASVTTVEMVPALAAIGQHVVAANGFGGLVTYVEGKSLDEQNQLLPKKVEALLASASSLCVLADGTASPSTPMASSLPGGARKPTAGEVIN